MRSALRKRSGVRAGQDTQRQFGGNKAFLAQKLNSKASTGERDRRKEGTCNSSKIPKAKQDKTKPLRCWGE